MQTRNVFINTILWKGQFFAVTMKCVIKKQAGAYKLIPKLLSTTWIKTIINDEMVRPDLLEPMIDKIVQNAFL